MSCSKSLRRYGFVLVAVAPLLAGCTGDPPSAFQHEVPFSNPLLQPGLRGGVNVPPVGGAPADAEVAEALGGELAASVATALRDAEFAALAAPVEAGRFALRGQFDAEAISAGRIRIAWRLLDDSDVEVSRFVTEQPVRPGEDPGSWMSAMAGQAAAAISRYVAQSEGLPPPPSEMPKVMIAAIEGAPGSGGRALASALEYHLKQAGLAVSDTVEDHGALVTGRVAVTPAAAPPGATPRQTLSVSWTVSRPDGSEVGKVEQANDIPKGMLVGPWGDLAYVIAEGAAEGIIDLLRQTVAQDDAQSAGETVAARANGSAKNGPSPHP